MGKHYTATIIITETTEAVEGRVDEYGRTLKEKVDRSVAELGKMTLRDDSLTKLRDKVRNAVLIIIENDSQ